MAYSAGDVVDSVKPLLGCAGTLPFCSETQKAPGFLEAWNVPVFIDFSFYQILHSHSVTWGCFWYISYLLTPFFLKPFSSAVVTLSVWAPRMTSDDYVTIGFIYKKEWYRFPHGNTLNCSDASSSKSAAGSVFISGSSGTRESWENEESLLSWLNMFWTLHITGFMQRCFLKSDSLLWVPKIADTDCFTVNGAQENQRKPIILYFGSNLQHTVSKYIETMLAARKWALIRKSRRMQLIDRQLLSCLSLLFAGLECERWKSCSYAHSSK